MIIRTGPHRPRRTSVLVLAGISLTGLALSACGSSGGSGGGSTPPPSTTTVTSSTTESTTTTAPAGGASSSPGDTTSAGGGEGGGSLAACAESQLRASIDPRPVKGSSKQHTPGADYAIIVDFRNTSSTPCAIQGYPGAAIVDASGHQVKNATRTIRGALLGLPTGTTTLPTVTLQPGAYASAGLEGVNQQEQGTAQAGCEASDPGIVVTPPNTRTPVPFTVSWPKCFTFTVHPTNIEKNPPTG